MSRKGRGEWDGDWEESGERRVDGEEEGGRSVSFCYGLFYSVTTYLCYSYVLDLILTFGFHYTQFVLYTFFFGKGTMYILHFTAVT